MIIRGSIVVPTLEEKSSNRVSSLPRLSEDDCYESDLGDSKQVKTMPGDKYRPDARPVSQKFKKISASQKFLKSVQKALDDGTVKKIGVELATDERIARVMEDAKEFSEVPGLVGADTRWDFGAREGRRMSKLFHEERRLKLSRIVQEAMESTKYVILPHSRFRMYLDYCVAIGLFYIAFNIPLNFGFYPLNENAAFDQGFGTVMDSIFVVNVITNFNTAYYNAQTLTYVRNRKKIVANYLKFWFWVDLTSMIPFQKFVPVSTFSVKWLKVSKWGKLPRLLRLSSLMKLDMNFAKYFNTCRIGILWFYALHWATCLIAKPLAGADSFPQEHAEWIPENLPFIYKISFRQTAMCMLGVSVPNLSSENELYVIGLLLFGFISSAILQANIFSVVYMWLKQRSEFFNKVSVVDNEMEMKGIPKNLRNRVRKHYKYLWKSDANIAPAFLKDHTLSFSLRKEIALVADRKLILSMKVFRYCPDDCIALCVMAMNTQIYLNDEVIVNRGDAGRSLFVIAKGKVQVMDPANDTDVIAVLGHSDTFGEMSLLSKKRQTRRCSVIASQISEVKVLSHNDFIRISTYYPVLKNNIHAHAVHRAQQNANKISKNQENNITTSTSNTTTESATQPEQKLSKINRKSIVLWHPSVQTGSARNLFAAHHTSTPSHLEVSKMLEELEELNYSVTEGVSSTTNQSLKDERKEKMRKLLDQVNSAMDHVLNKD